MTALASEVRSYSIAKGLDFILSHFRQNNLFPRKISTKTTQGKQLIVYSREEALARFNQANLSDCRISAYHATDWRKGLSKLIAPDFLFMDLDLRFEDLYNIFYYSHCIFYSLRANNLPFLDLLPHADTQGNIGIQTISGIPFWKKCLLIQMCDAPNYKHSSIQNI